MVKKYEYHKQNEYPGERIAERERVADRKEAADKRSDARVAEKGRTEGLKADARVAKRDRMHGEHMDSERERSTDRATRVNRKRNAADSFGLLVIAGLIVIILAGSVWGVMTMQKQSDEIDEQSNKIDTLTLELANAGMIPNDGAQLNDEAKQVQLYKDFVVLTNNVRKEITALEDYNMIYSDTYQLCSGFTERENSINHALYRFAEKEIVYYEQIAVLADKPECDTKIETMRSAMKDSKATDEKLYALTKDLCDEITNNVITDSTKSRIGWEAARAEATAKAEAFDAAEESVIECFA